MSLHGASVVFLAGGVALFFSIATALGGEAKNDPAREPSSGSFGSGGNERLNDSRPQPSVEALSERKKDMERRRLALRRRREEAVALWEQAVERSPTAEWYYHQLAFSLTQLGRGDEAIAVCDRVLVLQPLDTYALSLAGNWYFREGDYPNAIRYLRQSLWFNPTDFDSQYSLGSALYRTRKYRDAAECFGRAVKIRPRDFDANYWHGLSLSLGGDNAAAVEPLKKAVELKPSNYLANHWAGYLLVRTAHHKEAIPFLERSMALRKDARDVRMFLFSVYLLTGEYDKAFHLFPVFSLAIGTVLLIFYALLFALLTWLSFRNNASEFPGLFFSTGWLVLFIEGQVAFIFLIGYFVRDGAAGGPISAAGAAAIPTIAVALLAFRRRAWGAPFRWPLRLGGWPTLAKSALYLVGSVGLNLAFVKLMARGGYIGPLQKTAPLMLEAVRLNPVSSLLAIGIVLPIAEEILFRGLLFGALQKHWRTGVVITVTALLFAAVHMELFAYIPIFVLGLVLGWARSRSGSIGLPILIHSTNNFLAICALLAGAGS